MLKTCSKCKEEKDISMFYKKKSYKDGLDYQCKNCVNETHKKYCETNAEQLKEHAIGYREDNKERIIKYRKEYRKENKEYIDKYQRDHWDEYYAIHSGQLKEYQHQYNKDNKELISKRNKVYNINNAEHIKAHYKIYYEENKEVLAVRGKKWRENNKELVAEGKKHYYKNNIEHITEYLRNYSKNNVEQYKIYGQRRRALKRQLPATLTKTQWEDIKAKFNNLCAYCGKEKPLEQEHFVALTRGGEYTVNNIIPSCKSCNCSKSNKDFFIWYSKYKGYSVKREKIILKYLGVNREHEQQLSMEL